VKSLSVSSLRLPVALIVPLAASALAATPAFANPYPGLTGRIATADSAATAGDNPAGSTRFDKRAFEVELMWLKSDSTWKSEFSDAGEPVKSSDSGNTYVPRVFYVQPINDDFAFSFTLLGVGFSDDLGNWPGRYFIKSYDSLYASAFPSLAWKVNEQWSVAGSVAITYTSFKQERMVANIFDPGFGDGKSEINTDSVEYGFGLSTLYQHSDRTRWGLTYSSEIDATQQGDNKLSGLGPRTEEVMGQLGILNLDVEVKSKSPQSVWLGFYHEFDNAHALAVDAAWVDFSSFKLSEFYFNGDAFLQTDGNYNDVYGLSASYTWPIAKRWKLGLGGLITNQLIDDDDRTSTLRLDSIWSAGVAAEWQWDTEKRLKFSLSYLHFGDAPVSSDPIPGVGSYSGKYTDRDTLLIQIGMTWGSL
jgi:long-chain fatty acid transport protein